MALRSLRVWLPLGLAAVLLALVVARFLAFRPRPEPALEISGIPAGLQRTVAQTLIGLETPDPTPEGPAYVALRSGGLRLGEAWGDGPSFRHATMDAIAAILEEHPDIRDRIDTVELCWPHSYRGRRLSRDRPTLANTHRGILGLELTYQGRTMRECPTSIIARNLRSDVMERRFRAAARIRSETFREHGEARLFGAHQRLLALGPPVQSIPMDRGNRIVPLEAVDREAVTALAQGMGDWLVRQLHPDGHMTYMYYPSSGNESRGNNMIRQYMASVCLVRLARYREDEALARLAFHNLNYNFSHFYRQKGDFGLISYRGKRKLGAAALAALAIVESPFREDLADYENALVRTTRHLQQEDGSFHTFFGSKRRDNQNFYPGETLLLWATLYEKSPDPELEQRFMRAFRYYRNWHLDDRNRNPAFIPWHTQAYYRMWLQTQDPELQAFVFDMNDWLLGVQQWKPEYPDQVGRFHDPRRPFGPPHASSTGVYLEGLIDAYRMARAVDDDRRAAAYRRAIIGGLRSLMQLQFTDDVDMYYVSKQDRVRGGIRTTVYNNVIRVDNVQHGLMGILNILKTFSDEGAW